MWPLLQSLCYLKQVCIFLSSYYSSNLFCLDIQLNPALLGLGLTYTINLAGMFQYCVRQSTEVENIVSSFDSVILYYSLTICV